jgi:hypothetical protein
MLSIELTRKVELRAREIAGSAADPSDLAEPRLLIERAACFGRLDCPSIFKSPLDEAADHVELLGDDAVEEPAEIPCRDEPATPEGEPQRTVEAMRRILPDLQRLSR